MAYITYQNIYSTITKQIITEASIHYKDKRMSTYAIWDTGASNTHITENVIEAFEMESSGTKKAICHSGEILLSTYTVTIGLPTNALLENHIVYSTTNMTIKDFDIGLVIGMDIIRLGDFHFDNCEEKTIFTFRHPFDGERDKMIITHLF